MPGLVGVDAEGAVLNRDIAVRRASAAPLVGIARILNACRRVDDAIYVGAISGAGNQIGIEQFPLLARGPKLVR